MNNPVETSEKLERTWADIVKNESEDKTRKRLVGEERNKKRVNFKIE